MLNSGDDMAAVIPSIYTPRNVKTYGEFRSVLKPKLVAMKVILPNTLIDPNNPRLIVI